LVRLFKIYHATCHADLVRSTARQAAAAVAAAAAAATATAESMSALSPSSTFPAGSESSGTVTSAQMDIKDKHMKEDIKPDLKHLEGGQHEQQDSRMDHDMTPAGAVAPESDLPTSLKRKVRNLYLFFLCCSGLFHMPKKAFVLIMINYYFLRVMFSLKSTTRRSQSRLPRNPFFQRTPRCGASFLHLLALTHFIARK
jgi:hypothetical protein